MKRDRTDTEERRRQTRREKFSNPRLVLAQSRNSSCESKEGNCVAQLEIAGDRRKKGQERASKMWERRSGQSLRRGRARERKGKRFRNIIHTKLPRLYDYLIRCTFFMFKCAHTRVAIFSISLPASPGRKFWKRCFIPNL